LNRLYFILLEIMENVYTIARLFFFSFSSVNDIECPRGPTFNCAILNDTI